MIKLVTIDLDGTLLANNKSIPEKNIQVIKEAKKVGCKIVIATGRPYEGVKRILKTLNLLSNDDYVILYNGAKIINAKTKEVIYSSTIKGKDCKDLLKESYNLGTYIHAFYTSEKLIANTFNAYSDIEAAINKTKLHLFDFNKIDDNDDFIKCMLVAEGQNIDYAIKHINPYFKDSFSMVRSSVIFLEFLKKGTDKGNALIALKNYLGLKDDETMAIGDAGNDLGMIKKAHIGVAVKNAFPEVIKASNYITNSTNNEGAVAEAINKFVLKKGLN